jgi:hypothetical protein
MANRIGGTGFCENFSYFPTSQFSSINKCFYGFFNSFTDEMQIAKTEKYGLM